jgi:GDP-mannose 6-dehydrogenase
VGIISEQKNTIMKVSIFGLGYVGAVTAGCLTDRGHLVIGVDVNAGKVAALNAGKAPIVEPELEELLQRASGEGRLEATVDAADAVERSEVGIVCVGTPALANGRLNLAYVRQVTGQIAAALRASGKSFVLVFRSTMLPGSCRQLVEESLGDLIAGGKVKVFYFPEFLREGTAVADFRDPSLVVVGTEDGADPGEGLPGEFLGGKPRVLTWEGAEMIKYACNYFHALKVGYANEIGRMGKHLGVDGAQVMEAVCADTRLNISAYYLRPGNPFGGSCLPKDVSALLSLARTEGVSMPLLEHTMDTNQAHLDALIRMITRGSAGRKVGLLGLAFKAETDDLRGSPMVAVAETLIGRGYELKIYDPQLQISRLIGANWEEIKQRMPHLASVLVGSAEEAVASADIVVAAQRSATVEQLRKVARPEQRVIDVNGWRELKALPWQYEGFCW